MSILNIKAFLFAILTLSLSEWAGATTYTYDNLNRLTAMAYTGGGSQTYTYDTAGNLLSMETTAPPASNYTLTLNRLGTGTGTVAGSGMNCGTTCTASVLSGSTVTLTATPGAGSSFGSWTGYAGCASANPCTFTMPAAAVNVTATFNTTGTTYPLAATASPFAGGAVTGAGNYAAASARTVTATANPGYTFSAWSGYAGCASANPCTFNMPAAAVTLVATFTAIPNTYPVTLAASPVAGGTVAGAGSYASGSARTVTATANAGYTFSAWSGYAGCTSVNPCNFTMPASAVTMTASFAPTTVPLSGLVAYYCFDDPANLGKDCSTNGNNGTPTGGVSAVAGKAGGAALFGGFNNPGVIRVPNSPTLQFGTTSSISFFVKIDDRSGMDGNSSTVMSPNGNFSIVAKRHDQQGVFWNLSVNAANQLWLGFGASSGSMTTTPGTDVLVGLASGATGRWVHVVQVVDSVGFKTYFDGQLAWSMSGTVNFAVANTQDMYIGKYSDYWYPLNGTLDELKIFNRALSAAEVQSLYGSVTYPLTASASPAASGSVSGAGSYAAGATRSVVATANPGYAFSSWSGYAACASVNPCTFTMPAAAVNLTAVFVAAPPKVVSFNPATLSFTDQSVGTTSPAKTVILTNTGNAALSITSVLSSINVFGVTHNCGNSLAAGAACNLSVTFKPTAVGTRAGSITLTSNAAGSPHSVTVSGFGVSPNAPICTLSATPATVRKNGPSTLTASCSPPATSYSWTGGTCAGKTASTCMVSPSVTTTYSVTGTNSYGSNTSAATVTVNAVDLTPILMLLLD